MITTYGGYLFGVDIGLIVYGRCEGRRIVVCTVHVNDLPTTISSLDNVAREAFLRVIEGRTEIREKNTENLCECGHMKFRHTEKWGTSHYACRLCSCSNYLHTPPSSAC